MLLGNLTIKSWNSSTSAFDKTEATEDFNVDSSGYAASNITLSSDANGNQTYDGLQAYTYDAWNRLKTVAHAYGTGSSNAGQVSSTMSYDGLGRRITKTVSGTGSWDCTYHYYLDKNRVIEERNGSNLVLKQFVWGRRYIDELVQTSINSDPTNTSHQTCDVNYWAMQDANFNVLGIADSSGVLKERYEYGPYGQRTTFISPGTNDPYCMSSTDSSQRVVTSGSVTQPYGICEVGHQGLLHDEESGLVNDRSRYINPATGRFLSRDRIGYFDSMNLYEYVQSNPFLNVDPLGLAILITYWDGTTWQIDPTATAFENALNTVAPGTVEDISITGHGSGGIMYFGDSDGPFNGGFPLNLLMPGHWLPGKEWGKMNDNTDNIQMGGGKKAPILDGNGKDLTALLNRALTTGGGISLQGCNSDSLAKDMSKSLPNHPVSGISGAAGRPAFTSNVTFGYGGTHTYINGAPPPSGWQQAWEIIQGIFGN